MIFKKLASLIALKPFNEKVIHLSLLNIGVIFLRKVPSERKNMAGKLLVFFCHDNLKMWCINRLFIKSVSFSDAGNALCTFSSAWMRTLLSEVVPNLWHT